MLHLRIRSSQFVCLFFNRGQPYVPVQISRQPIIETYDQRRRSDEMSDVQQERDRPNPMEFQQRQNSQNSVLRVPHGPPTSSEDNSWRSRTSPNAALRSIPPPKPQPSPVVQESHGFRSRILDIGHRYNVNISYVEDGPLMFSVQLGGLAQELHELMNCINNHPTELLSDPPLIGAVCLGRHTKDKALRRAVVMNVTEQFCKVHYVDFGFREVLPHSEIYQLPRKFLSPNVLAVRFTMSNVNQLHVTEEMKEYFKNFVAGKSFVLHVRPPEGSPLIQYGDIYEGDRNVKEILKQVFGDVVGTWRKPQKLVEGTKEMVVATYIETCHKFYVQREELTAQVEALTKFIADYSKKTPNFPPNQIKVGLHCVALSSFDFQW